MPLTFVQKIELIVRRVRRRRTATVVCWALVAIVVALLSLIWLDRLLGVNHVAGRALLTLLWFAAIAAIVRRSRKELATPTKPLAVALKLEELYPEHRGLFASGLEFSRQAVDDPTAGSMELRRAVVLRAALAAESVDLHAVIPRRPIRRAIGAAAFAMAVTGALATIAPQIVAKGAGRLLNPLSGSDWLTSPIEVGAVPEITLLEVIATPPSYTGLPQETFGDHIRVLRGTRLSLKGATTEDIRAARIHAEGKSVAPLEVSEDRRTFRSSPDSWQPEATAEWSIELTARDGTKVVAGRRLVVEVTPDRPPAVEIAEPTRELAVLPDAKVDMVITADDDLSVEKVELVAKSDDAEAATIHFDLPNRECTARGAIRLAHEFDVSALGPSFGSEWRLHAKARDSAGHESTSVRELRLRVISLEEFIRRLDELKARLEGTLERALAAQVESRSKVDGVLRAAAYTNDVDSAAALQRRVRRTVSGDAESAVQLLRALSTEYQRNRRLDERSLASVESAVSILTELAENQAANAEEDLASLQRDRELANGTYDALAPEQLQLLSRVREEQDKIVIVLKSLLSDQAAGETDRSTASAGLTERRLAALTEAERELDKLRRDVDALMSKPSATSHREVAQDAKQLGDELEQLRADDAARHVDRAAESLLMDGTFESARSAQRELDEAREILAGERRQQHALVSQLELEQLDSAASATAATPDAGPLDHSAVRNLVKDIWGALPERQREEILQPFSEEFLPEYAEEIEEYFRVLAETPADDKMVTRP